MNQTKNHRPEYDSNDGTKSTSHYGTANNRSSNRFKFLKVTLGSVSRVGIKDLAGCENGCAKGCEHEQADLYLIHRDTIGTGAFLVVSGSINPVAKLCSGKNHIGDYGNAYPPSNFCIQTYNPLVAEAVKVESHFVKQGKYPFEGFTPEQVGKEIGLLEIRQSGYLG